MNNYIQVLLYSQCILILGTSASPLRGRPVTPAGEREFPFIVAFSRGPAYDPKNQFCGGALISNEYVLTAKHCLVNPLTGKQIWNLKKIKVAVGSHDMVYGGEYGIDSFKTYEQWVKENKKKLDDTLFHDIAVAKLDHKLEYAEPVKLSRLNYKQLYGKNVVTMGWGVTNRDPNPRYLQKAELSVISTEECKKNYEKGIFHFKKDVMDPNHLCTKNLNQVALGFGDDGSPLLYKNTLVGINSHVVTNDRHTKVKHNAHQSIDYYRDFIEAHGGTTFKPKPWWKKKLWSKS